MTDLKRAEKGPQQRANATEGKLEYKAAEGNMSSPRVVVKRVLRGVLVLRSLRDLRLVKWTPLPPT